MAERTERASRRKSEIRAIEPTLVEDIARRLSGARVPGCAVLRVSDSGEFRGVAVGVADVPSQRPMTLDSIFHLFSGTKVVTASALMRLVEREKISLDDDVREILPELDLSLSITLRQLASHSSGLPDTLRAFFAIHYPEQARPTTADALARYRFSRCGRPGERVQYRNANYALLAEVIARVAKTPFEQFVSTELLSPWGSSATFEVASADAENLATGHVRRFDPMRLVVRGLVGRRTQGLFRTAGDGYVTLREFDLDAAGAGGLLGSVFDFAPILREFLSTEDGVLSARSKREMLAVQARGAAGITSRDGVGIAWKRGTASGRPFWNHEGGGAGFCTELRLYADERVGFVILMNVSQNKRLSRLAHDICERLRDE